MGLPRAADIARASGVPATTLRSYFSGKADTLNSRNEMKIARALGLSVDALYGEDYSSQGQNRVWVKGYLGAGGGITPFEGLAQGQGFYDVAYPTGAAPGMKLAAMEIRGFSMPPAQDGWLVYYEERGHVDLDAILNRPCVVELKTGDLVFKTVRRGFQPGRFSLHSWDGREPMDDVEIRRAMPIVALVPPWADGR
ncbi:MAG: hypothetical protein ACQRW7_11465 [Caulobacterales bacterium]|uniref:XRE family transcriptional regulator n=1 Tax=Glycocaulis sp. TaxID=1969725 RepID=UPI003FA05A2C